MNDEAESSHAGLRHANDRSTSDVDPELENAVIDEEEEARKLEQRAKERRLDAKKKRIVFLDHLLRELDSLIFVEFITLYYLDCSFFWFVVRAIFHTTMLTPLPDLQLARQQDEHKPFLPMVLVTFAINFLLHIICKAPSAGEDTRGYLHGGLMIDFIGQQGPTSKWKLAGLDICILLVQLTMVSVHVKRRELKKKVAKISGGSVATRTEDEPSTTEEERTDVQANSDRDQDADAEERGVLRRTDTFSDTGADPDEEDALLATSSEPGHADALDILSSGQAVVGDFTLIDTLIQEHNDYQAYRQTRSETTASNSGLSPTALRQLHSIRVRFGVGGG